MLPSASDRPSDRATPRGRASAWWVLALLAGWGTFVTSCQERPAPPPALAELRLLERAGAHWTVLGEGPKEIGGSLQFWPVGPGDEISTTLAAGTYLFRQRLQAGTAERQLQIELKPGEVYEWQLATFLGGDDTVKRPDAP
jgi:N-acetyl-beta-hexosaminidase